MRKMKGNCFVRRMFRTKKRPEKKEGACCNTDISKKYCLIGRVNYQYDIFPRNDALFDISSCYVVRTYMKCTSSTVP